MGRASARPFSYPRVMGWYRCHCNNNRQSGFTIPRDPNPNRIGLLPPVETINLKDFTDISILNSKTPGRDYYNLFDYHIAFHKDERPGKTQHKWLNP